MASVCKRHKLGSTNGPRQSKVVWTNDGFLGTPSPTLYCRDSVYAAYAELCGPDDILDALWGDVQNCAGVAAGAATLAAIFASPAAATAAFEAAFKGCLAAKVASRVDEIQVHLGTSDETGDWGPC
jgi:hypothetical protein